MFKISAYAISNFILQAHSSAPKKKPLLPENTDLSNPGGMNFLRRVIKGRLEDNW